MEEGVWRTIKGRKVFIKKGQNLSDAMRESGKFDDIMGSYNKNKEKFKQQWDKKDYTNARKNFYKELGYDKHPQKVSEEEFNKIAKDNFIIVRSADDENIKNFVSGEYEVSTVQNSMYGTGIYFAYDEKEIEYYKNLSGQQSVSTIKATLAKDTKIINSSELRQKKEQIRQSLGNRTEIDSIILADNGVLASSLGYDAVNIEDKHYILLLNRQKAILKDDSKIIKNSRRYN